MLLAVLPEKKKIGSIPRLDHGAFLLNSSQFVIHRSSSLVCISLRRDPNGVPLKDTETERERLTDRQYADRRVTELGLPDVYVSEN